MSKMSLAFLIYAAAALGFQGAAFAIEKPVQVYILSGQSNMVGIGQVTGAGQRWGQEFIEPTLFIYAEAYTEKVNYKSLQPVQTLKLDAFGGVNPTPYPKGGTHVVRGRVSVKESGVYEFRPGYGESTYNTMTVNGQEAYRRELNEKPKYTPVALTAGVEVPFEIIYFTPQADGLGWLARVDRPGTLATVVKQHGKFKYLLDKDGNWKDRNDVWYRGLVTATANQWLSVGCGASRNSIGPELGFGNLIGDFHDAPVLLIKSSQGNRSLGWDFLPPGSKSFQFDGFEYAGYGESPERWEIGSNPKPINWYAGKQYDECFHAVKKTLSSFSTEFPQWKDRGYQIAGFVWWQGHKDGGEPHAGRYEKNLERLIKTLRKEFEAPNAPFVIGTIGFDGWNLSGDHLKVAEAQIAVSTNTEAYPDFQGNVTTVETRDFWRSEAESPRAQGFHYNQNAETYMLVGEAMARGMIQLKSEHR